MSDGPVKVLLAESDEPTRLGIRLALEDADFAVCCEPLDAGAAVREAVRERPLPWPASSRGCRP